MTEPKKIFLSYAREESELASEISVALSIEGHDVFFDKSDLDKGKSFHDTIRKAVQECDIFIFLISPDSQRQGKYSLTELGYAKEKWRNPSGKILPVMAVPTPYSDIDTYLKAVTVLEPEGNTTAEVVASVTELLRSDDPVSKTFTGKVAALTGSQAHAKLGFLETVTLTAKEWLPSLLNQPTQPPFEHDADFRSEMGRVFRLVAAAVLVSVLLLGAASIIRGNFEPLEDSAYAILAVLIVSLLVALTFRPLLYICGVRVRYENSGDEHPPRPLAVGQIFYSVILTFVPWIPIFIFLKSVQVPTSLLLIDLLIVAPFVCFVYMIVNFAKSIKIITNESWHRIAVAMLIPLLISMLYLFV